MRPRPQEVATRHTGNRKVPVCLQLFPALPVRDTVQYNIIGNLNG